MLECNGISARAAASSGLHKKREVRNQDARLPEFGFKGVYMIPYRCLYRWDSVVNRSLLFKSSDFGT